MAEETDIQTVESEEGSGYIQKISWEGDENAWQYGVQIVSEDNSVEPLNFTTENTFVTFTLPPGNYRYKISVYDLFGRVAVESKWEKLTIKKALKPVINLDENIIASKKKKIEIPVNIEDVSETSEIVIVNPETKEEVKAEFEISEEDGKQVVTSIKVPKLKEGNWMVKVTNPGGKSSVSDDVAINIEESVPLNLSIQAQIGYPYLLPINDTIKMLDKPTCFEYGARISITPINFGNNYFGFEGAFSSDLISQTNEYTTLKLDVNSFQMNVLYKYEILPNILFVNARLGWGGTILKVFATGAQDYDFDKSYMYPSVNAGASVMYKPIKLLNIELGVQSLYIFTSQSTYISINPLIMVGVSF